MGSRLSEIEAFERRLKRKPLRTFMLLVVLIIVVAGGAWLTSYFSEKGKQTAAAARGDVKFKPTKLGPEKAELSRLAAVPRSRASQAVTPSQAIALEQVTVGLNSNQSRVDFALRNRSSGAVVIREIELAGTRHIGWSADCLKQMQQSVVVISVSDLLAAPTVDGARILGRFENSSAPGFDYPVSGSFSTSVCGPDRLSLETEHTVELPEHSLTIFRLVVPRTAQFERRIERGEGARRKSVDIDLSTFHTLTIRVVESGGAAAELELERQAEDDIR